MVHALRGHALVVGQRGDLPALRGFHPAAAEGHFLEAVRLPCVGTADQPWVTQTRRRVGTSGRRARLSLRLAPRSPHLQGQETQAEQRPCQSVPLPGPQERLVHPVITAGGAKCTERRHLHRLCPPAGSHPRVPHLLLGFQPQKLTPNSTGEHVVTVSFLLGTPCLTAVRARSPAGGGDVGKTRIGPEMFRRWHFILLPGPLDWQGKRPKPRPQPGLLGRQAWPPGPRRQGSLCPEEDLLHVLLLLGQSGEGRQEASAARSARRPHPPATRSTSAQGCRRNANPTRVRLPSGCL